MVSAKKRKHVSDATWPASEQFIVHSVDQGSVLMRCISVSTWDVYGKLVPSGELCHFTKPQFLQYVNSGLIQQVTT